jgi:hypothetical protein
MSACVDIEIRPEGSLTPTQRAKARDCYVRDFERQFSDWASIAKCCIEVERDKDYLLLGFPSWHAWLLSAAPKSRSYIYLVVGRYKELIADIPEQELAQIPLGSAGVLKQLSPAVRRESKIRQAAKGKPSELRQAVKESFPEQHIEGLDSRMLNFTESQAAVYDEMLACHRAMNNPETSAEEIVEMLCADWLDATWDENAPYSNRQRAQQLREMNQ